MKSSTRGQTVIYGTVLEPPERDRVRSRQTTDSPLLIWKDSPDSDSVSRQTETVMVDLDSPDFSAPAFLVSLATACENLTVIGKCNDPSVEKAMQVAKLGVSELLTSEQCLERLQALLEDVEGDVTEEPSSSTSISKYTVKALIGASQQMQDVRQTVEALSEVDFPSALVLGETGTGKSLISRILHYSGARASHNLVEVNCSAIPDELFESELFGHAKGAFTDAKSEKTGLFEYAQDGTIFLDEVGNLSPSAQAKLLKIVEEKKLRKVGSITESDINVRVVAATNLDLDEAIQSGRFREDLFFRLNLLTITIPPLCERTEDIEPLVHHYLAYYATNYGKPGVRVEKRALQHMMAYSWPGNIRELCNVVERAVLLTKSGSIGTGDISSAMKSGRLSIAERAQLVIDLPAQGLSLEEIEEQAVKQVLNMCNWNKTEAARFLSISRPRLRRIIQRAGLTDDRRKS